MSVCNVSRFFVSVAYSICVAFWRNSNKSTTHSSIARHRSRANHFGMLRNGFLAISPAKKWTDADPNHVRTREGNSQIKWAILRALRTTQRIHASFLCLCMSVRPPPNGKYCRSRLLMTRSISQFIPVVRNCVFSHVEKRGSKKWDFRRFGVGRLWLGYSLYKTFYFHENIDY